MAEPAETSAAPQPHDIRPIVARPSGNRTMWIFGAILVAAGGGMFYALQLNRMDLARSGIVQEPAAGNGIISSPPELEIPPGAYAYPYMPGYTPGDRMQPPVTGQVTLAGDAAAPRRAIEPARSEAPLAVSEPYIPQASAMQSPGFSSGASGYGYQAPVQTGPAAQEADAKTDDGRAEAGRLRNPGTTVPQGTVIQAVMETALDSTRAGFARAIISRDVLSFDGRRVLIPKGSKLFGEYQADVSLGQKRALIQWRRLTRPDGAIIDIDSPSADPLGRAGLRGKVNTHFFERFGGAILQSMLDLGVRAATREAAGDTVVVALPSTATQVGASTIQRPDDIKPTLKIRQGASVSVFVARDLDFTKIGG